MPITPPIELISTIRPARCARIAGRTCWTTLTQPQKLVSNCALASGSDESSAAPARPHPAAATPASIRPAASSTPATPERTDSSLSTSITRPAQPPEAVPRLLAPLTVQPAACRRSAQALPMPADAPVTRTDLAVSLMCVLPLARTARALPPPGPALAPRPGQGAVALPARIEQ